MDTMIRKPRLTRRQLLILSRLLIVLAIALFAAGLVIARNQHQQNKAAEQAARHDPNAPKTNKPSKQEINNYQVPADAPRYLLIPELSVRAMVKPLGLTAKNQIAAPSNVFDAGWYTGSAKPGKSGAMLIDGHVSSWTTHGIFYNLKKLSAGDRLQIQRGDGTMFTYRVVKSQVYDVDHVDMQAALAPVTPGRVGLNLITCDGSVIKGTNEFNKRLVVFTELL
jgi:LPXTG-site transpeptidase (sortase) family protein